MLAFQPMWNLRFTLVLVAFFVVYVGNRLELPHQPENSTVVMSAALKNVVVVGGSYVGLVSV